MARVLLENVTKRFGSVLAVDQVNLEIRDKEFLVLVGPSGCGKSTTLRMVAGLEEITEGSIFIDEVLVNDVPPKDRDIAMVFQNYALYPHMDVYNNMAFGLKLRKLPKNEIDRRVKDAARLLGIENLLERKPKALSGGQRQRVAVGRAIVREPKVFLMDEPLSNLDAKLRVQMRAELIKLHHRLQTTVIYVTHDQTEAMTMGDRIVVMKDGIIHQVGAPLEIYNKPVDVFVAGFIGSPAMNFLDVWLNKDEDGLWLETKGNTARLRLPEETAARMKNINSYIGKEVVFGIRPENMEEYDSVLSDADSTIQCMVEVREPMGAEIYLYLLLPDETTFVARVDSSSKVRAGEAVQITLDMNKCYLFDKETEKAIR
ncbi:MAG: sn-glycerol-3-phosphate ABC transporter ATP-binding protein UgpC [Firmicutes bacterium]|jgi:multiple sugar transport system ATP-binding protein|nr:sn-glycerol-3-phosphate ABC transporter ATP-binding protein UgpC [Bacillota bacterium]